ncbi:MAG: hypothetical protein E7069_02760 [Bacteroidales bacterium]|nr:hypothetical protein [Bacteroidales bacterium]
MKTKQFAAFLFFAAAMTAFVACDKDDDAPVAETPDVASVATVVAGEYNGTLSAKIESMSLDCGSVDNQTITITAAEDGTIGVAIPAFTYAKMGTTIPAATLNGIAVAAAEDGSYTIGETEFSETVTVDGAEKTYSGTMSGTISANKKATIVYELKYGKMPMAITFTFETSAE